MEIIRCHVARVVFSVSCCSTWPSAPSFPAPHRLVVRTLETSDLELLLEALNVGALFQWMGDGFLLKVHVMPQNLEG